MYKAAVPRKRVGPFDQVDTQDDELEWKGGHENALMAEREARRVGPRCLHAFSAAEKVQEELVKGSREIISYFCRLSAFSW